MGFNGTPTVFTRGHGGPDDKTPVNLGSLSAGGITGPTALAGTNGVNVELVHGDCYANITGNVTVVLIGNRTFLQTGDNGSVIKGNVTEMYNGNHTYEVTHNLTSTVDGKTTQENVGPHLCTNSSTRRDIFVGPVTRNYQGETTEEHPETWVEKVQQKFHFEPFKYETVGSQAGAVGLKFEAIGAALEACHTAVGMGGFEGTFKFDKMKVVAAEEELHEAMIETFALQMHLGAMDAGTPFKPNALPRPTPITPFD